MTKLKLGQRWAIILETENPINPSLADVFVLDLFDTSSEAVKSLKNKGKTAIAYFSAGSFEPWRPDAKTYPKSVIGKKMKGWDEYWVNIQKESLLPIIDSRLLLAKQKGFDGVDLDNMDVYSQDSGFKISEAVNKLFLRYCSRSAHAKNLIIGLKNCPEFAQQMAPHFDFSINEEASEYGEQEDYKPFTDLGKPVVEIEYKKPTKATVDKAKQLKYELLYYPTQNLNAKFTRY